MNKKTLCYTPINNPALKRQPSDEDNWQLDHTSVLSRLKFLLFNKIMSDVTFIVGSQNEHDLIIPDVELCALRNLLRFIYTAEVHIKRDTVMASLYAAKQYAVDALERCTLESVLSRDSLRVREIVLYDAVMRWSEAECRRNTMVLNVDNRRGVLKDCINLTRYPLMASQEFSAGPAQNEPVEVLPHTSYCAVATLKGRDSYYGTRGARKVTVSCRNDGREVTF
ncbi:hypothetical protein ILUMI_13768 [Ignelater luminosus]|uniref:BACK domain-containing protein n=1 Tax=Ignelater luminosus TaxID=2038154 RepID=A0A8K0CRP1_IGNLU|nr:hypothetical protein ILUMI_13768 [Ignelater luminosus]